MARLRAAKQTSADLQPSQRQSKPQSPAANRHPCAPQPSFLRRQEPSPHPPSPIHPSPLSGGRLGGGSEATHRRDQRPSQDPPKPRTRVLRSLQSRPAEAPADRFRRAARAGSGATLVTEALLHDGNPVYRGGEPTTTGNGYVASPAVGMSSRIAAPHWGTATLQRAKRHESRLLRRGRRHRTGR